MARSSAGRSAPERSNGEPSGWPRTPAAVERLATATFIALVVASFAAFFVIQALKHAPKPIDNPKVQLGLGEAEQIEFELAKSEAVTVTIVGADEKPVRALM